MNTYYIKQMYGNKNGLYFMELRVRILEYWSGQPAPSTSGVRREMQAAGGAVNLFTR